MAEESNLPDLKARDVVRLDGDHLRAALRALPLDRQVDLVLSVDWQERLRLIKNSNRGAEIVRALPREEVFLTIKNLEEEDALVLFAPTTPSQLRFILDVELWKKDDLDDEKVLAWLRWMLACGETKIIQFVTTADMELLALFLKRLVYLLPNEEGVTVPEGLPSIMPDEFFTILCNFPEDTESIGLFLRIVRQASRDLFYKLIFAAYGSAEVETEEEALRWRTSRLEESGFLDFDEAIEIYGYIGEDEARQIAGAAPHLYYPRDEAVPVAPGYPVLLADKREFLYEVLAAVGDRALANRLRQEIAFSANRLLVADAEHIGEMDSIKKAIGRLFSLTSVGLLFLAGGDKAEAARILADVPLREVFQIGFSRAADLRNVASELARRYWPDWADQEFLFLGSPASEMMRGLLMRVPQYYEPGGAVVGFRDFVTMTEVRRTRDALELVGVAAETCFDKLGIPKPREAKVALGEVFVLGIEDITLQNLLLTGFVNLVLRGSFNIQPLAPSDAGGLFSKVMEQGEGGKRVLTRASRDKLLAYLAETTGFDEARIETLRRFVAAAAGELEAELGGIASPGDLDPRYVRSLLFRR